MTGVITHRISADGLLLTSTSDDGERSIEISVGWGDLATAEANYENAMETFAARVETLRAQVAVGERRRVKVLRGRAGNLYLGTITGAPREYLPSVRPRLRDEQGRLRPGLLVGWFSTCAHLSYSLSSPRRSNGASV